MKLSPINSPFDVPASMCVLYTFYLHNETEIVCMVVLVVGSESSQNWVRVVSGLGPIRLGSEKYQGSELSWVRVVRLPTISSPCEPDGSGELKRYKLATIRKKRNQKKIPTPKTEAGKNKLTIRYLYHEYIS